MRLRFALLGAMIMTACATSTTNGPLGTAPELSSGRGTLAVSSHDGKNTRIELKVSDVTAAPELVPGATAYVVWAVPTLGLAVPRKLGALEVDEGRSGKLVSSVPYTDFRIYVTPESSPQAPFPTREAVIWGEVLRVENDAR